MKCELFNVINNRNNQVVGILVAIWPQPGSGGLQQCVLTGKCQKVVAQVSEHVRFSCFLPFLTRCAAKVFWGSGEVWGHFSVTISFSVSLCLSTLWLKVFYIVNLCEKLRLSVPVSWMNLPEHFLFWSSCVLALRHSRLSRQPSEAIQCLKQFTWIAPQNIFSSSGRANWPLRCYPAHIHMWTRASVQCQTVTHLAQMSERRIDVVLACVSVLTFLKPTCCF